MKPLQVLAFLLAVLAVLGVLGLALPQDGLSLGNGISFRMPDPRELLQGEEEEQVDISDILAVVTDSSATVDAATLLDTVAEVDSSALVVEPFVFDTTKLKPLEERIALHYPNGDKSVLWPLFAKLEAARAGAKPIRIMHYGDSQLEGDRITSYVRNKLQTQFGGSGPGLIAVADIVPSFSVDRVISANWTRYSVMGKKDPTQQHDRFGVLSSFSRFTPIMPDTVPVGEEEQEATILLKPLRRAFGKAQQFTEMKLYYGWHRAPVTMELRTNGSVVSSETIEPADQLLIRTWKFAATPEEILLSFKGADSPDVYGISLEGRTGIAMDNIAARGAAGYEFRKTDQALLRSMYNDLGVQLLILQYGGNVVPNLKGAEDAAQYGRFFGAQIARFKKMMPNASIIVIGPSDMSIKDGENYVTRPLLEEVRDAMKANTLAQGAVFWDMYEAMGGRNSMVSWVNADPPLAATDYTHFSPQGSKKVGELFYTALINDFAAYYAAKQN